MAVFISVTAMFDALPLSLINLLLAAERWAADLLRPHAGQTAALQLGGLSLRFTVTESGMLHAASKDAPADLSLSIAADVLTQLFDGPEALRQAAHIEGNARFAESVGLLLQHLRPDLAGHFAPLIGDVAAHRLGQTAASLSRHTLKAGQSLAGSALDALRAPGATLVGKHEMNAFSNRLEELLTRLQKLEKRLP
ncbi:SCP2 domain-containing protein [Uliginosibacterium sp. 31-12]|uniref:ubiquinone biosynthesis accessory factor UbiJ n=1 Tax=Uliginosibacterium sp. 31-12 TaxID=3062781 RepID=UPI0026E16ED8|nr:SCP2 sterol-binding domain-containing protein [Uliginosibacterium sp. 31-12]MDO6387282.1 SCP2 sterol-binding domain-containing protein [Uliginosibacterium sp. 31-12]